MRGNTPESDGMFCIEECIEGSFLKKFDIYKFVLKGGTIQALTSLYLRNLSVRFGLG